MPLPFIIAGAAIAATAVGAKKTYDGYQDKNRADDILEESKGLYRNRKELFDKINDHTSMTLESLGELELRIGSDFERFDRLVEEILKNNNFQKYGDIKIVLPKHKLNKIKEVAISATDYLKTVVGGGVSGAAAGFAVYSGVMALGAASTGTPIAALSGVAAYNATMAAIGGGSLAAGGWGMAGGAMVLGGAVVAPVLAVAGIAYALHGSKALKNAQEVKQQVADAITKMDQAKEQLLKVDQYAKNIMTELEKVYVVFNEYFDLLKDINEIIKQGDMEKIKTISSTANLYIQNGVALAAIMAKLISTPLFKVKRDFEGEIILGSDNNPQIQTDENGMQILDKARLDRALETASEDFDLFKNPR
ncbi:chemotaxis protein [Acinetobacter haemolyticus]|uniref:chemotaxis protein n=2 Tax=Acinetobacter haemolyticus TaxID=29430 RepID=UPI001331EDF3|nr:chemotaxis protein [Acinetobacter haemolyticus]NAR49379.1 chemotaxis protein [Acinetobacter haemolyticus]NAR56478.1 chemotaxis protein [Acinetobacter haemolyticus]NAR79309.1 chemotaxis protein [Acinetobacter haemolyticus]NAR89072.1 chemotaxis protein [Acinetobacter haemolyticus]NAR96815.1 chemotaxis protein [Acinetobacter haemolyticus]